MAKTLHDVIAGLPAEERARIEARAAELLKARQACHPSELPKHLKKAVAESRMERSHDHLNKLLDQE